MLWETFVGELVYRIKETCFVVIDESMFLVVLHSVINLGLESKRLLFAPQSLSLSILALVQPSLSYCNPTNKRLFCASRDQLQVP